MCVSANKLWLCASAALLAALVCARVWAQGGRLEVMRDFKHFDYYVQAGTGQTNRLKSLVSGAEARPASSNRWWVTRMKIESWEPDGRTNLVARAPECLLDPRTQVASSTGRLEVAASEGRLFIEGEGFWCCTTNRHIIISNRVRTTISHELLKSTTP
jgi:hypothetical protein